MSEVKPTKCGICEEKKDGLTEFKSDLWACKKCAEYFAPKHEGEADKSICNECGESGDESEMFKHGVDGLLCGFCHERANAPKSDEEDEDDKCPECGHPVDEGQPCPMCKLDAANSDVEDDDDEIGDVARCAKCKGADLVADMIEKDGKWYCDSCAD